MNLNEEINYLSGKQNSFDSFVKAFYEDTDEFGLLETITMYSKIYGFDLNESVLPNSNEIKLYEDRARNPIIPSSSTVRGIAAPVATRGVSGVGDHFIPDLGPGYRGAKEVAFDKATVAGMAPAKINFLKNIWNKIKGFTTGQFASIKSIVSSGKWAELLKLPIFKGALAVGGAAAVIAILKKLFGKKKITAQQEAAIKAKIA